jgi:hypothetical protein
MEINFDQNSSWQSDRQQRVLDQAVVWFLEMFPIPYPNLGESVRTELAKNISPRGVTFQKIQVKNAFSCQSEPTILW